MPALRARSIALTGYLEALLGGPRRSRSSRPRDPAARGAQLSLRHDDAEALLARLAARGVVADYRAPDLIRVAPDAALHDGRRGPRGSRRSSREVALTASRRTACARRRGRMSSP